MPMVLPALMRGEKVFKRASNAGVALSGTSEAVDLVKEKLASLELAINDKTRHLPKIIWGTFTLLLYFITFYQKRLRKSLDFCCK